MKGKNMEIKTGIDIIEVSRIKKAIQNSSEKFLDRIFTVSEIEYCSSKKETQFEHFAARFAAKEACFKAISSLLVNKFDIEWKEIEILNTESGKPVIKLHKNLKEIENIDVSLSHIKDYAIASVSVIIT